MGIREAERAGHHAAPTAVATARTIAPPIAHRRQVEAVDAVRRDRLEPGSDAIHPDQAQAVPHTAGQTAPTTAPLASMARRTRRSVADCAEHAHGAQAALGHHGEAGHGHQADEEQHDRGHGQHGGGGCGLCASRDSLAQNFPGPVFECRKCLARRSPQSGLRA